MDISDRLKTICDNKKIKNIDLVNLGCGSQQTVSFVLNGKNKPNPRFLEVFLKAYPDVNARWLITGDGETQLEELREQYGFCKECIKKDGIIEFLKKECADRDRRIRELTKNQPGGSQGNETKKKAV